MLGDERRPEAFDWLFRSTRRAPLSHDTRCLPRRLGSTNKDTVIPSTKQHTAWSCFRNMAGAGAPVRRLCEAMGVGICRPGTSQWQGTMLMRYHEPLVFYREDRESVYEEKRRTCLAVCHPMSPKQGNQRRASRIDVDLIVEARP